MDHVVYLALGSNLGNKEEQLRWAVEEIKKQIGELLSLSAFYVTAPCGFESSHVFLNAACAVKTNLSPFELLSNLKSIEKKLGRSKKTVEGCYEDRLIDIDILFYDQLILETEDLTIPHPLLHQRDFVLKPLLEIAPDWKHPVYNKTIRCLYEFLNVT